MSMTSGPRSPTRKMCMGPSLRGLATGRQPWRGTARGGVLRKVRVEVAQDRVLGPCARDPNDLLARLEEDQGGDRHDTVRSCGVRVVVDVQLRDLQIETLLLADLLDD